MFDKQSYAKHAEWYNKQFSDKADKFNFYSSKKRNGINTIATWLQQCFFDCLVPLLNQKAMSWLTVGDAYGFDAEFILKSGSSALATDLNTDFLSVAKEVGIVNDCAAENAEQLTFGDSSFDYVLCKESYHHFPRPYSGLYEMIRVSRKGIVLIEPNDPVIQMPLLLLLTNFTKRWPWLQQKIWHNRFSYEPVGNFVYKVSKREFEKFAAGLQLPAVAFKCFNPNFYKKQYEYKPSSLLKLSFLLLRIKKLMLDVLMKLNILPGQVLSAIIFKELPDIHQQEQLKAEGYSIVLIPKSPY